jgi:hypothetical protein
MAKERSTRRNMATGVYYIFVTKQSIALSIGVFIFIHFGFGGVTYGGLWILQEYSRSFPFNKIVQLLQFSLISILDNSTVRLIHKKGSRL